MQGALSAVGAAVESPYIMEGRRDRVMGRRAAGRATSQGSGRPPTGTVGQGPRPLCDLGTNALAEGPAGLVLAEVGTLQWVKAGALL